MDKKIVGYVNSFETMGLVDGPGIRFVVFLNGCKLRCLYCHNPEMWSSDANIIITPEELVEKIKRYLPYYENNGGVTFSGGDPLLQSEFLIETLKLLKENNIHTAIDTSGVGNGNYEEILKYVDLVILDIKASNEKMYKYITNLDSMDEFNKFVDACLKMNKEFWIRQVIVPGINDTKENILELNEFLKKFKNVSKVELLPYHTLGVEKYHKLKIKYPLEGVPDLSNDRIDELSKYLDY